MGQSELLLTIGAIVAFSVTSLTVNRLMVRNNDAIYDQQTEFYALGLAQQIIEEAKVKEFDENTIDGSVTTASGFTTGSGGLGKDSGESYPHNFDDVDDYIDIPSPQTTAIGPMTVNVSVFYVQETDLDTNAGSKTYYKKMIVTVQSPDLVNQVTAEYVFGYQKNLD